MSGQEWTSLNGGVDNKVIDLFTYHPDTLLLLGKFSKSVDETILNGVATWDGQNLGALAGMDLSEDWEGEASNAIYFQDELYFVLSGYHEGGYGIERLAKYDGQGVSDPLPHVCKIYSLGQQEETLVIGGLQTGYGGMLLYQWDTMSLDSLDWNDQGQLGYGGGVRIDAIEVYQEKLYVAGNILDGVPMGSVFSYNDGEIEGLDGGVQGLFPHVYVLGTYNDQLILGGSFSQQSGNPTNNIISWDGFGFNALGDLGANSSIHAIKVYGGYLYVAGYFTEIDGLPCKVARWDGESWEVFSNSTFGFTEDGINSTILDIEIFHDQLFVSGNFKYVDGVQVNNIVKYVGPLALSKPSEDVERDFGLSIYPNPVMDQLQINFGMHVAEELTIIDELGRIVETYEVANSLNVAHLTQGYYLLNVRSEGVVHSLSFIKK